MKIHYWRYRLSPLQALNSQSQGSDREGALLRLGFSTDLIGYADLHPWPELGDANLQSQLAAFERGEVSNQMQRSIDLAHADAELRSRRQSIFALGPSLRNNLVITDLAEINARFLDRARDFGFTCLKMKVGRNEEAELAAITQAAAAGFRLRLDFNSRSSWNNFQGFIAKMKPLTKQAIEYVEDPFPFDPIQWALANEIVPLALDQEFSNVNWDMQTTAPFRVLIIKPAKISPMIAISLCRQWNLRGTVTSYMDHPVGVMHALNAAMELARLEPERMNDSGCWTHLLYHPDLFSRKISSRGPFIVNVPETGVGFDSELASVEWLALKTKK